MNDWGNLQRECEAWAAEGRSATWWWRDDDAVEATPALQTLLALEPRAVALAVIPARMRASLPDFIGRHPETSVLQHGFAHVNHARPDERKSELPDSREPMALEAELADGQVRLRAAFGERFLPVMTPPWNRAGDRALSRMKDLGFRAVSRYLPRTAAEIHGLMQVNTHVDVIDWKGSRGFAGEAATLSLFTDHLAARRLGTADRDEPTGLLTHHLVHDPATWRFIEKLRNFLEKQPAARLLDPGAVFSSGNASGH